MATTRQILERFRHNFVNAFDDEAAHHSFDSALADTLLENMEDGAPAEPPKRRGGPKGPRKKKNTADANDVGGLTG